MAAVMERHTGIAEHDQEVVVERRSAPADARKRMSANRIEFYRRLQANKANSFMERYKQLVPSNS